MTHLPLVGANPGRGRARDGSMGQRGACISLSAKLESQSRARLAVEWGRIFKWDGRSTVARARAHRGWPRSTRRRWLPRGRWLWRATARCVPIEVRDGGEKAAFCPTHSVVTIRAAEEGDNDPNCRACVRSSV